MTDNLLFDDLYIDLAAEALREMHRCIDEVFKSPGLMTHEVAERAGLGAETAGRRLSEARSRGEVRRDGDRWFPND